MSKSFTSIKTSLGLYDFFNYGKYKNCRVDSILEEDPGYIIYISQEFKSAFTKEVLKIAETKKWVREHPPCDEEFDDVPY